MFSTIILGIAIIGFLVALHYFVKAAVMNSIIKDVNKRLTMKHKRYEH